MERSEAENHINKLYGTEDTETVTEMLERLGTAALTDEAVGLLARLQLKKHDVEPL